VAQGPADSLTAICEPIVKKMWEPRRLIPYGPPQPVTGIALPLPLNYLFFSFRCMIAFILLTQRNELIELGTEFSCIYQ
jgi:hypothetical protein